MPYYRDLREHVEALEAREKLIRVSRTINKDTTLHPLVRWQFRGLEESQRKAFLFESVVDSKGKGYEHPVLVGGLAASEAIYAIGLKCGVDQVAERWYEALESPVCPEMVRTGPVKEVIHQGLSLQAHGGLEEFPIPISTPGYDVAPYLTCACWITKDPETGRRNMGIYRGQVKGKTRLGVQMAPEHNVGQHWNKYHALGRPMEAAAVIGGPPCIPYAAIQSVPYGVDELDIAGGLAGEPIPLVKCETVDLEVPAFAEIVIEGLVSTEYLEPEASFGESHGYCDPRTLSPLFEITCISHRTKPIWLSIISQLTPSESSKTKLSANQTAMVRHLRDSVGIKGVMRVVIYDDLVDRQFVVIQMKKRQRTDPDNALLAALAFRGAKIMVAVDDDIDPEDLNSVNWAMTNRCQPHRDMKIISGRALAFSPLKLVADGENYDKTDSALLVDATRKTDFPPVALPAKKYMEEARGIWEELGLPELRPRRPWHGYPLGWWPGEAAEEAELAVQGECYKTAEKLEKARTKVGPSDTLQSMRRRFSQAR